MDALRRLWAKEPARVIAILVAVVVFVLAKAGVVVDEQNVGEAISLILPILVGGELVRSQVTPAGKIEPVFTEEDLEGAVRVAPHGHVALGDGE